MHRDLSQTVATCVQQRNYHADPETHSTRSFHEREQFSIRFLTTGQQECGMPDVVRAHQLVTVAVDQWHASAQGKRAAPGHGAHCGQQAVNTLDVGFRENRQFVQQFRI